MLSKPDIVTVLNREGIELKNRGKNLWALCPLHSEKTSSFKADPEKQTFHCFGCGAHGDIIDFICKYKNLSFKDACRYLGMDGKGYKPDSRTIRKRELVKEFKEWCSDYHNDLCALIRILWKAKQQVKDEAGLDKLASYYHFESVWLYQIEILQGNGEEAKFELYREIGNGKGI